MKPAVLQLIDSFHQGGSERQAVQLTRLLQESGRFSIHLGCLSPEGVLRKEAEDLTLGHIASYPLSSFHDRNAFAQLRRFVSHLKQSKISIIQTHDFYTNIFGMTAGALARIPVRIASRREIGGMRTDTQKRIERFAYSWAHQIVANSEAVRKQLTEEGIRENRISVIYNGLDLSRIVLRQRTQIRSEALAQLGVPAEADGRRRFVTIVANMRHAVKDYPMFLRAARSTLNVLPDTSFLLAGEGELTPSIRRLAHELGVERDTFFLGRCENVSELLNASDVCVLSSNAEGFSNSILEYMAAARPVVATDVGGAREAIVEGQTGYLVKSGDAEAMADRIITVLRDPERARAMGEAGRRVVEQRFSCEAQLKRTEELYDRLLKEKEFRTRTQSRI